MRSALPFSPPSTVSHCSRNLRRIDRVDAELRGHATDATCDELRDGADLCRIVMALEGGQEPL